MKTSIGIAGAGLMGRWLALFLAQKGWDVSIFDRDDKSGKKSCSWVGAGMLTPFCELENAEPIITALGMQSHMLGRQIISRFEKPVFMQGKGSLVVAHPNDRAELDLMEQKIRRKLDEPDKMVVVGADKIAELEPELANRRSARQLLRWTSQTGPSLWPPRTRVVPSGSHASSAPCSSPASIRSSILWNRGATRRFRTGTRLGKAPSATSRGRWRLCDLPDVGPNRHPQGTFARNLLLTTPSR